jgi:hypothetical protein
MPDTVSPALSTDPFSRGARAGDSVATDMRPAAASIGETFGFAGPLNVAAWLVRSA